MNVCQDSNGLEKLTFDHIMLKQLVHVKRASVELGVVLEKLPSTEKLESQSLLSCLATSQVHP